MMAGVKMLSAERTACGLMPIDKIALQLASTSTVMPC